MQILRDKDYLLLAELVGQVGNHDLGGTGDTILRGASLLLLNLALEAMSLLGTLVSRLGSLDVGGLDEREDLTGNVGRKDLLLLGRAILTAADSTLEKC